MRIDSVFQRSSSEIHALIFGLIKFFVREFNRRTFFGVELLVHMQMDCDVRVP